MLTYPVYVNIDYCMCSEYNEFASSVSEESNKMKAVQKEAVARQLQLDEESLQRLKEAEAKDKVHIAQQRQSEQEEQTYCWASSRLLWPKFGQKQPNPKRSEHCLLIARILLWSKLKRCVCMHVLCCLLLLCLVCGSHQCSDRVM